MLRVSKIVCVSALAFFCLLIVFGNLTDYAVNFSAVSGALSMKGIYPISSISYRSITSPLLQHLVFIVIICFESLTALLCTWGAWQLFKARKASPPLFNQAKNVAIAGLTCGFVTWQVLFMSIAGEWFGVWMSPLHGAVTNAFQMVMLHLGVLIYLMTAE